uniref:non-specific serine/threonine protein kinase n=1 Tax=Hemiselmis tepida TaxID=464990 RepID=A0A7S0VHZ0_9CRYP|mmetsp:Transcript_19400/g.49143  ORF Transcript_19400/g.49143 Transcript_19400/m.49143 type:complete len:875 (+) Transcript_19400:153-2777(+)
MGHRDYTLLEQLGRGAQGVVHKAKRVADGSHVAVKQVFLSTMSKKDQAEAAHEVRVLSKLSHPNVIRYLDSFNHGSTLFIVTELAEGGNLTDALKRIRQRGTLLSEKLVWKYFLQTAVGLQHIHSRKILHRDIKTMNIFLTKDDNIKVGDLGVARMLNNTNELANTMVGTPYYLSPELCEGRPYNDKSDVWSLGCVLYELCTLKHPFDASNQGALILKIIRGKYPPISSSYSCELKDMLSRCLDRDTNVRPRCNGIFKFPGAIAQASSLGITLPSSSRTAPQVSATHRGELPGRTASDGNRKTESGVEGNKVNGSSPMLKGAPAGAAMVTKGGPNGRPTGKDAADRDAVMAVLKVGQPPVAAHAKPNVQDVRRGLVNLGQQQAHRPTGQDAVRPAGRPSSAVQDLGGRGGGGGVIVPLPIRRPSSGRPARAEREEVQVPLGLRGGGAVAPSADRGPPGTARRVVGNRRRPGMPSTVSAAQQQARVRKVPAQDRVIAALNLKPTVPDQVAADLWGEHGRQQPPPVVFPSGFGGLKTPQSRRDRTHKIPPSVNDLAKQEVADLPDAVVAEEEQGESGEVRASGSRGQGGESSTVWQAHADEQSQEQGASQTGARPKTAQDGHDDLLNWFKSEHLPPQNADDEGFETEEWEDDDDEEGTALENLDWANLQQQGQEWGGSGVVLDALMGPSAQQKEQQGRTEVAWRVMNRDEEEGGKGESQGHATRGWSDEEGSEYDEDAEDQTHAVPHDDSRGEETFEVVHVRESVDVVEPSERWVVDDEAEQDEGEESLLQQRVRLLATALRDARAALVAALGEEDFQVLCEEVLKSADSEDEGLEWKPTRADPDGRYMLQVFHYIYLEEELMRCKVRASALQGSY